MPLVLKGNNVRLTVVSRRIPTQLLANGWTRQIDGACRKPQFIVTNLEATKQPSSNNVDQKPCQRIISNYRRWHVTISCQPDGRPPQPVRPWKLEEWTRTFSWGQQCSCFRTRNTFCQTRSLSNATFSFFDHVMKIGRFFTEIWRYIDFQNDGCPPSWNCFTTIRDHSRSPCCWPQVPVKCHVNLTHRSEDTAVCIFSIFGLKCLFRSPKLGFWGLWTLTVIIHHRDPKRHILA